MAVDTLDVYNTALLYDDAILLLCWCQLLPFNVKISGI